MARIIWLGESHLCRENELPPAHTTWGKYKFPVGQPVEVTDQWLIDKARANKFFEVVDEKFGSTSADFSIGDGDFTVEVPMKRRSGWPKGKPRKPRAEQQVTDGTDNQLRDAD